MGRPKTDIRERILLAARVKFLQDGVDGASLREIASKARTSIGMIFYYFPTKEDLFLAVVEGVYAGLLRDLEEIIGRKGSARDRLTAISARLGAMSESELEVVRLVVREALLSSRRFASVLSRFQRGHLPLVLNLLAGAIQDGEVDPTIPPPMLLACTLGVIGLPQLVRRIATPGAPFATLPGASDVAALAARILFEGIAPPPRARKKPARRKR